ncbi:MAG: CcmD family protein [Gemmatimonadota bacterium]|jgi:CcmD family protein
MIKKISWMALVFLFLGAIPSLLQAQSGLPDAEAIAGQNLRGYTHMFIAYFIAWALILGWVISIARRLGRMEKALKE